MCAVHFDQEKEQTTRDILIVGLPLLRWHTLATQALVASSASPLFVRAAY